MRKDAPNKTPKFSRQNIVDIVRETWLGMAHAGLSAKGYEQLGPTLPMDGSRDAHIFRDLLPWWEKINGSELRARCIQEVSDSWDAGIVRCWADASNLIEQHAPHKHIDEGQEHVP